MTPEQKRVLLEKAQEYSYDDSIGQSSAADICAFVESLIAGWQDIATAPKDGTEIIGMYLHIETQIVHNIFWMPIDEFFPEHEEGWWSYDKSECSRVLLSGSYEPTYWMPLPPAPLSEHGKEG